MLNIGKAIAIMQIMKIPLVLSTLLIFDVGLVNIFKSVTHFLDFTVYHVMNRTSRDFDIVHALVISMVGYYSLKTLT